MEVHAVLHIPTLHGKIFEGIFPMWKYAKLLPFKSLKSNLNFMIYCPNFGGNYSRRQASRILASVRKELGKKPHHKITVTEFAAYYGISTQEIEDIIFFNDN